MKTKRKVIVCMLLALCLASTFAIFSSAVTGYDSTGIAVYNYDISVSWWPWSDVKAYSNTSFVLSSDEIMSGFDAYSSVFLSGTESNPDTVSKIVHVSAGTNYAHTGDVSLDGHRKDSFSIHKSVCAAHDVDHEMTLSFD